MKRMDKNSRVKRLDLYYTLHPIYPQTCSHGRPSFASANTGLQGISMPLDQFNTLIQLIPNVETAIKEKGGSLDRPNYVDGESKESSGSNPAQESSGSESDKSEDN